MFEVISERNGIDMLVLQTSSLVNAIEYASRMENDWQILENGKVVIEKNEKGVEIKRDIRSNLLEEFADVVGLFIAKICGFRRLKDYYQTVITLLDLMS